ncbi:MAG: hypothetical protein K2R98_17160 [Gemmataceae bacterium]|nr:hypothetical protein [Gemmataceae bacterium]
MLRRSSLIALSLVVLVLPAFAQDKPVEIKWKFEKGKPFYQELKTETSQDMKVMGMDVKQKQTQTFFFSWTPVEQKDKDWIIKQKIEGVKMEIVIGGNTISYDSTNPGTANNPLSEFFKALVGSEFTLTVGPDMKVTKVEGRDEFLKKLVAANQQMKPLLDQILSENALKQMADPSFAVVPPKGEAKKDETWENKTKLELGPIGSYDTTYTYKFLGEEKGLAKIGVTAALKYNAPGADGPAGGLPFKIKEAKLESKNATGTVFFDPKAGRVDNSEMNLTLEGTLQIEIGGMTTTVELKQTQKTTVKTTAESPIKKGS